MRSQTCAFFTLLVLAPEWVIRVRFSPDGSRLFSAGGTIGRSPDRKVSVWGLGER